MTWCQAFPIGLVNGRYLDLSFLKQEVDVKNYGIDQELYKEVEVLGARDMEICMQCGTCSASCPLSSANNTFPRRIYRYLQLGLRDKLLQSPEPWLCYYCGDCNLDCPRGAEPAETMMATRRWLTTQYDVTGLAKRLYLSKVWEFGSLVTLSLFIVLLFAFFHGPVITDHVSVNTFAPVIWIEIGDLAMAAILSSFLMMNAFRMFRFIKGNTKIPLWLYLVQGKEFVLHFLTQKRWKKCSTDNSRWIKHLLLVTGYLTMMLLVIVFIRWFQVDDNSWHFTSIFGYYATGVLMFMTAEMFISRLKKKKEAIHRFSHSTDWLFLVLLFMTSLTGILMHGLRLLDLALPTYIMYVIHLAIAVPMLVVEVPFGKWSHLFYRPLAIFMTKVKEKAEKASALNAELLTKKADELFMACMQCGTCTALCPVNQVSGYSPRQIIRSISMDAATLAEVDERVWDCATCLSCVENCPRGIEILDLTRAVREHSLENRMMPKYLNTPLASLKSQGNPWQGQPNKRMEWMKGEALQPSTPGDAYCLFTCCTTAYDKRFQGAAQSAGQALVQLLRLGEIKFGTLGNQQKCCGDLAYCSGDIETQRELISFTTNQIIQSGWTKLVTNSPHCLNSFNHHFFELKNTVEFYHYTKLLYQLINENRLKPENELNLKVTYHDPCYLGRYNGIYDEPRQVLKSIPGLELVEMDSNRAASLCCGGGGSGAFKKSSKDISLGEIRVHEALKTGAQVIATACPYCIQKLNEAIRKTRVDHILKVQDVAEILFQSIPNDFKQEKNKWLKESESMFATVE